METEKELAAYKLKKWERKLLTAQTYVRKYKAKLKRLEKKEQATRLEWTKEIEQGTRRFKF